MGGYFEAFRMVSIAMMSYWQPFALSLPWMFREYVAQAKAE